MAETKQEGTWLESLALIHTTDEAGKKRNPNTFQVVITHSYPMVELSLARCVTFTSRRCCTMEKKIKSTYSKESHATLKSKLQIELKMNIYEV